MQLINSIRLSITSLIKRPVVTILILIASAMGIIVVVAYIALFRGLYKCVMVDINKSGIGSLLITRKIVTPARASHFLKLSDVDYVKKNVEKIEEVIPIISNRYSVYSSDKGRNTTTQAFATNENFMNIFNSRVLEGRSFTKAEFESQSNVCVIEKNLAIDLFGNYKNSIRQKIKLESSSRKLELEVIGVVGLEDAEQATAISDYYSFKNVIFPISLVINSPNTPINSILIRAKSLEDIPELKEKLTTTLSKLGRAVNVNFNQLWFDRMKLLLRVFGQLGFALTIVCLFSEGITIITIMIISVKSRFREIAIRKTEGATKFDIVKQFLTEGAVLSLLGSFFGIPMGVLMGGILSKYTVHWPVIISTNIIALAILVALIVGILSSVIPAIKAANLDPIEGLKYH